MGSGVDKREVQASTCDVLLEEIHARDAIVRTPEGLDLMPGNTDLTAAEIELMDEDGRDQRLTRALEPLLGEYEYTINDSPDQKSDGEQPEVVVSIDHDGLRLMNKNNKT